MSDHPLFPPLSEDDEAPEVEAIHVSRFENGNKPFCAYLFGADELTTLQQIFDLFGGGKYELIARAGGRISAKRCYELAGKSRPLVVGTVTDEPEPSRLGAAPVQVAPVGDAMTQMLMQFMQIQAQSNQQMMQMMMASSQQTMTAMTTMTTAMLSRDGDGNKTLIQALQVNNERALQGQAQVFSTMLEAMSKSGGGKDVLSVYKEGLADASGGDDPKSDDDDPVLGTIKSAVEGLKVVSSLTGDGPPILEEQVA